MATRRKPGRPSKYSLKLAQRVCEAIACGESLVSVTKRAWAPSYTTVMKWCRELPEFAEMYARAREDQADYLADRIVEIADGATPDDVQVAKLRVDARKWTAAKLKPRKYGERVTNEHTGPGGGPIVGQFNHKIDYDDLSAEELEQLYRDKLKGSGVEP